MDILYFVFGLCIFLLPFFNKRVHLLEIMPLFLLYFDVTHVFVRVTPIYVYFEYTLILLFSIQYVVFENKGRSLKTFWVFPFLTVAMIVIPIMQGLSLDPTIRSFSFAFASIILLPLSFSYYSKTGNVKKLLLSTFWFIVIYVLFVFYATPRGLGGEQSVRVAGTVFYFGHVAIRGGITYIGFVLLMVPLIVTCLQKKWQKIVLMIAVGIIFIFLLTVLKRFVFIIIGLGILNYLFHPGLKTKLKVGIVAFFAILIAFYYFDIGVQKNVRQRFEERGGERKYSEKAILGDLRIYEPIYALRVLTQKTFFTIWAGDRSAVLLEFEHEGQYIRTRRIHNDYAAILLSKGLIGLFLYLMIYYAFYRFIRKYYKVQKIKSGHLLPYWIAFQNMVLIFVLQGMVGGHAHVSLRGLVLLYSGALGGIIYHAYFNET